MENSKKPEMEILESEHYRNLVSIGLALSNEKDLFKLLELVVDEARSISNAEGGTLYTLDSENKTLRFEILQNERLKLRMRSSAEKKNPLPDISLYLDENPNYSNASTYVALTGSIINVPDVYQDSKFNFEGLRKYDRTTGYLSKSMLILPLKTHDGEVLGVLQLINAKDPRSGNIVPFPQEGIPLVSALASQASIALENANLIKELAHEVATTKQLGLSEKNLNEKLRGAFLELERTNDDLKNALKKVRVVRAFTTAFVALILIAVVIYPWIPREQVSQWLPLENVYQLLKEETSPKVETTLTQRTYKVVPQPIKTTINLPGMLSPFQTVHLTSPFEGFVKEIYFKYGQLVEIEDLLLMLDTSQLEEKLRDAQAAYLNALDERDKLANWKDSVEVSKAKRSLEAAKMTAERQRQLVEETKVLFDKGIIAETELKNARDLLVQNQMSQVTSAEELDSVLDKGNPQNLDIANLKLKNEELKVQELETLISQSKIYASVSGTVLLPTKEDQKNAISIPALEKGKLAKQGSTLVAIGNMEGLSVKVLVDETEVNKIKKGQKVKISGEAFPEISFNGRVDQISTQATRKKNEKPKFETRIIIRDFDYNKFPTVLLGMTAELEIIIYEKSDAILVPIDAVQKEDESHYVMARKKGKDPVKKITVETGTTTLDSVQITKGLKAGDEVVY